MPHLNNDFEKTLIFSKRRETMGVDFPRSPSDKKRTLRRLELEAYASVVSAFRAQGPLTCSKKSTLDLLCRHLSISAGRHRAEVRRAVNDDLLTSVAVCVSPDADDDKQWRKEGHRLAPSNGRFVSRPSNHTSQLLTAATLAATFSKTKPPVVPKSQDTTKLASMRPAQVTDCHDKKLPSQRVQNVLKYIIFQNPHGALAKSQQLVHSPSKSPARSVQSAPVTPVKNLTPPVDKKLTSTLSISPQLTKVLSPLKALVMSATAQTSTAQTTSGYVGKFSSSINSTVKKTSIMDKGNASPLNKISSTDRGLECDELLDSSPLTSSANCENAVTSHTDSNLRVILRNITLKTNEVLQSTENEALSSASTHTPETHGPASVVRSNSSAAITGISGRLVDNSESMVVGECEEDDKQDTSDSEDKQKEMVANGRANRSKNEIPLNFSPNKILSKKSDVMSTPVSVHLTTDPGPTPLHTTTANSHRLLDVCERKSVKIRSSETESDVLGSTGESPMLISENLTVNSLDNANSKTTPISREVPLLLSQASIAHTQPVMPVIHATLQASKTAVPVTMATSHASKTLPVTMATLQASKKAVPVTIATSQASKTGLPVTMATSQASKIAVPVTIATPQAHETAGSITMSTLNKTGVPVTMATSQASKTAVPGIIAIPQVPETPVSVTKATSKVYKTRVPVTMAISQASKTTVPVTIATPQALEKTQVSVTMANSKVYKTWAPVTMATSQASKTVVPITMETSKAYETSVPITMATSQASKTILPGTMATSRASEAAVPVTMATSQASETAVPVTLETSQASGTVIPITMAKSQVSKTAVPVTKTRSQATETTIAFQDTIKKVLSVTRTTLSVTNTQSVSLSHSESRKRPAVTDILVEDITPNKKQNLSQKEDSSLLTEGVTTSVSPPCIEDISLTQVPSVSCSNMKDSGEEKTLTTLKSITDALVSPTVIPDTNSLLQTWCSVDPYSLEASELASELGLDSIDPALLNLSGLMDFIQLPGTPTAPQPPASPMDVDVPHTESQTSTTPKSVDITLSVSGQAITSELVSVVSPHLFGQTSEGKEPSGISVVEHQPVTVSKLSTVVACEADNISLSLGVQVKPAVTTSLPSTLPQLQFVSLLVPGSKTSIPIPVVAHHNFPSSLDSLVSQSYPLQQPNLTRTVCPTTSPSYAVFSPLSLIQDGSGMSLVSSSGLRPIPSTSVTSEVVTSCSLGSNDSPPPALSAEEKEITVLSSMEEKMPDLLETPFSVSHQEMMVDLSLDSSQLVQHKENVTSSPQHEPQVLELKHSGVNPKVSSTCPELLKVPSKPSPSAESQPVKLDFVNLTKEAPEVVQLIPKDVDLLQRLSLEGAEIGDIVGEVNEKELLEGIPLDLALAIQAIARIDEQDSAPWKQ